MSETQHRFVEPHLLELYRELRALNVPADRVKAEPPAPMISGMWQSGVPLLYCHPPLLDVDSFFGVMQEVGGILKKYHPERAGEVERMLTALPEESGAREQAILDIMRRDGEWLERLAREHELSEELTGLVVSLTLRPFLRHFSEQSTGHLDLELWYKNYCPVCGGHANFSRLSKAVGKRYLFCSLCETEWPFGRIACPFCRQTEEAKVRYFTVDDDKRYRVYVCDNCKGYIKAIDESRAGHDEKIELFWEDVKTVHLDLLAMREGYENKIAEIPSYGEEVKN
ncbi:MAG: formate dehydrogenase accessory protein FdhE [Candidatus Desulforudis sp.]|nr:formate dehydrogenase accessory protein FdhE [Desulforudis sp.]